MGDKRSPTKTVTSWPDITFWPEDQSVSMNKEEFEEFKSRTVWPNGVDKLLIRIAYERAVEAQKNDLNRTP